MPAGALTVFSMPTVFMMDKLFPVFSFSLLVFFVFVFVVFNGRAFHFALIMRGEGTASYILHVHILIAHLTITIA